MSIIAVGSLAFDSITSSAGSRERILGGSLTHFANAASYYSRPRLVGVVGEDFEEKHWNFLKTVSSDATGVETLKGEKSFFWEGYYTQDFDNAITRKTELNAFAKFQPKVPESYLQDDYMLFLANIQPDIQLDVVRQCPGSRLTVLDTMNYWIANALDDLWKVIKSVDVIVINEGEARDLSGEYSILKAAEKLLLPNLRFIVLKKGTNGVMIFGKGFTISLPAFPVKQVVDPTGAGDSFAGAFLSYLDHLGTKEFGPVELKQAAIYATVVASYYVQGFGVDGLSGITRADLEKRQSEFKDISGF